MLWLLSYWVFAIEVGCPTGQLMYVTPGGDLQAAQQSTTVRASDGIISQVGQQLDPGCLPASLKEKVYGALGSEPSEAQQFWQLVFIQEKRKTEHILDPSGRELLRIDEKGERESKIPASDLPEIALAFMAYVHPQGDFRAFREELAAMTLFEVSWRTPGGTYEVEFDPSGLPFLWEVPRTRPLPSVIRQMGRSGSFEVAYLYCIQLTSDQGKTMVFDSQGTPLNLAAPQ